MNLDGRSPRLPALDGPPIGFGHRGAMAQAPENTIESFELAVNLGATGIESDVWVTKDGIPVLDHDGRVGRRPFRSPIAGLPRDTVPDHVPALSELFALAGPTFPLSLDVKDPDAFEAVVAEARRFGSGREENLWLCHPEVSVLTEWRPATSARLINSIRLENGEGLERRAAELAALSIDGLNLHHKNWNGGRIALLHRFGLLALGWGAVHEREVAEIVDAGIDAVYSDHVDRMMAVIVEYYGPLDSHRPQDPNQ